MPLIRQFLYEDMVPCFGSNLAGRHGKGMAKMCSDYYGAIRFQNEGLMGQCYAIPTKDHQLSPLPLSEIYHYVERFHEYSKSHPNIEFFMSRIGCGLSGYRDDQMLRIVDKFDWPKNVFLPGVWLRHLNHESFRHRFIVAGGRDFTDEALLFNTLDRQTEKLISKSKPPIIVCGLANGADLIGREYAKSRGLDWVEFPAPWDSFKRRFKSNKAAGYVRNSAMGQYGSVLSAFWNGSRGTRHMIELSKEFKLTVRVTQYDQIA